AAACSQGTPAGTSSSVAPRTADQADFSHKFVSVLLPPKVDFDFPFVLVGERLYTREDGGETRRGLMLEFTDGTAESVSMQIIKGFEAGGYAVKKAPAPTREGRLAFRLEKRGAVSVYVDVRPTGSRKLETAGAQGTAWL